MVYEERRIGRQKLLYNNTNDDHPLVYQLVVQGVKVTPTAATVAIWKPAATSATVAAVAASPGITGTLIEHVVDTTTTGSFPQDKGFRAQLEITYDSETYTRHFIFDVVKFFADLAISFDQLVALDGTIRGRHNDGDEDFGNMVEAVSDIIRHDIETKMLEGQPMLDSMVIDTSKIAVPGRFAMLAQIYENSKEFEQADRYWERYRSTLKKALSSANLDKDGDGFEDLDPGGITPIVLHK